MRTLSYSLFFSLVLLGCADDSSKPIVDSGSDTKVLPDYMVEPDATDDAGTEADATVDGPVGDTGPTGDSTVDGYISFGRSL